MKWEVGVEGLDDDGNLTRPVARLLEPICYVVFCGYVLLLSVLVLQNESGAATWYQSMPLRFWTHVAVAVLWSAVRWTRLLGWPSSWPVPLDLEKGRGR